MLKSKAIDILKTLSRDEFKRFGYFAESPYFNRNNSLIRLAGELREFYPSFDSGKMTEEYLYKKVFGNKYSYSSMKNLMSEMLTLCENFLIADRVNKVDNLGPRNTIDLLEELRERHLDKLFEAHNREQRILYTFI
ncbi:MAG: hypothetical protein ABI462_07745 [Ignavibacteria bacterium]